MRLASLVRTWRSTMAIAIMIVAPLALSGCSRDAKGPTTPGETHTSGAQECGANTVFHRVNFPNPTKIDNEWFPLVPGTQLIYDGEANFGAGLLPHRVILTVTGLTKTIGGVEAVVVWDRDYNNGVLEEAELAFFAQDREGNVWTLGEYPEEYQGGEFVGAPYTWITGQELAEAGVLVPGKPRLGMKFLQGFAPYVSFLDCAVVHSVGRSTCNPLNCYENVLVIDETSPWDPGIAHQHKFYASGLGVVRIEPVNDPEGELLTLTAITQLNQQALIDANAAAHRLEKRAYEVSDAYRHTPRSRIP